MLAYQMKARLVVVQVMMMIAVVVVAAVAWPGIIASARVLPKCTRDNRAHAVVAAMMMMMMTATLPLLWILDAVVAVVALVVGVAALVPPVLRAIDTSLG